jgi:hypothetical protein
MTAAENANTGKGMSNTCILVFVCMCLNFDSKTLMSCEEDKGLQLRMVMVCVHGKNGLSMR